MKTASAGMGLNAAQRPAALVRAQRLTPSQAQENLHPSRFTYIITCGQSAAEARLTQTYRFIHETTFYAMSPNIDILP